MVSVVNIDAGAIKASISFLLMSSTNPATKFNTVEDALLMISGKALIAFRSDVGILISITVVLTVVCNIAFLSE